MKFQVKFEAPGDGRLTEEPPGEIGIDMVDMIRDELNRPNLDVDLINGEIQCPRYRSSYYVNVTEATARTISLFSGRNKVTVKVPDSYLSKYENFIFRESFYDPANNVLEMFRVWVLRRPKKLTCVFPHYELNEQWLIEDWKEAGCPLKWGFNGENGSNAKKLAEKKNGKKS